MKQKTVWACSECGNESSKYLGRCPVCGSWNTLVEMKPVETVSSSRSSRDVRASVHAQKLAEISTADEARFPSGMEELDRVLGGGVVEGSFVLVGGEPGVGKSTLLMQICANISRNKRVLYVSGEESLRQLKLRALRLGTMGDDFHVYAQTCLEDILQEIADTKPELVIIDSIQTVFTETSDSAPGSVTQIRACAQMLMRCAKEDDVTIFLVGHVTKDGAIAGPRMLEHMVDVVLYFEGDKQQDYRLLRAVKNRFGSVNELGVFRMTGQGMQVVENPSEELLSRRAKGASGSTVFCGVEGSRPLLCDVQALTSPTFYGTPRRAVNGADSGRVAMLLAVLEKRANQRTYNQDVYINVAGGLELSEPAADLALCVAVASSLKDKAVGPEIAVMGEVGLAGEVRTVPQCDRRIAECARLGFTTIIVPRTNAKRISVPEGVKVVGVDTVAQALSVIF